MVGFKVEKGYFNLHFFVLYGRVALPRDRRRGNPKMLRGQRRSRGSATLPRCLPMDELAGVRRFRGGTRIARSRQGHRSAPILKRCRGSLEDSNQMQPFAPTGQWLRTLFNAIEKMLAFHFQGLLLLDVWNVAVPVV